MKKDQIKELLLKSVSETLNREERRVVNEDLLPDYSFSEGFRERVLDKLGIEKMPVYLRPDFLRSLNIGFRRVALSGVAVILILIASILLSQGSLSYDTLLGIDTNVDDSLISLLVSK